MSYNFLIDECLTPRLTTLAHAAGHSADSVPHKGWGGLKDHEIVQHVVAESYTLVTNNSVDFRGRQPPAPGGLFAKEAIHAGLICLNAEEGSLDLNRQKVAFQCALENLPDDLINKVMEVTALNSGRCKIETYDLSS